MNESSPITGSESLLVTVLPFESSTVPAGTMRSGRLPTWAGSRLGNEIGRGVPANSGFGRSSFSGTLSSARTSATAAKRARTEQTDRFMVKKIRQLRGEIAGRKRQHFLRGDGFVD